MKKLLILVFFLFINNNLFASNNIVYLDVQFIINNSDLGKFYKSKLKIVEQENKNNLNKKKKIINDLENEINNKKNILKKAEINNKVSELNKYIKDYQLDIQEMNSILSNEKKTYSKKILDLLNPILTNYVENNNITLVVEKKTVLIGKKNLDITVDILEIINLETKKKKLINE